MHLDLFISGPGYGETIILRWVEDGKVVGAVVDGYCGPEGLPLIEWLKELGIERLEFMVATHPHLDHISNLHYVLREFGRSVRVVYWWGGLAPSWYVAYFHRLATECANSRNRLAARAEAVELFLAERLSLFQRYGTPALEDVLGCRTLYESDQVCVGSRFRVRSISPWGRSLLRFTSSVVRGLDSEFEVMDLHGEANLASIGILIDFGQCQAILGGDVEEENWKAFRSQAQAAPGLVLEPSVVKVSHHGSRNGTIGGMWDSGGFFGSRKGVLAVVTPYKGVLPDSTVIDAIRRAGCRVFVTGQNSGAAGMRPWRSFVQIRLFSVGAPKVMDKAANVVEH